MLKTSIFYNPLWKDYICTECGDLYQFYVNGKCSTCRTPEREAMQIKLTPIFEKQKQKSITYSKNYGNRKKTKRETKSVSKRKRR